MPIYQYRTTYAGNDTYAGTNSTSVSVKVVSKTSVLAEQRAHLNRAGHLKLGVRTWHESRHAHGD
jgi:hypothetical protein